MKLLALLAGSAVVVLSFSIESKMNGIASEEGHLFESRASKYTKPRSDLCAIIILYKIVILTVSKLTRGFPYYYY